ncbi:hypothetical protein FIU75_13515 [Lactobacillus buchneri]|nr:hypothetical protein [Lentilactobacillus buchneri]MQM79007.1 hypothetical protein [Lentilactobacillus buchneri]
MEKTIVPVPTEKLQSTKIDDPNKIQLACQLTVNNKKLRIFNNAQPEILKVILRNCLRSKLSFGILLQKRKLLCLIIPVILLANSLKSFAQN